MGGIPSRLAMRAKIMAKEKRLNVRFIDCSFLVLLIKTKPRRVERRLLSFRPQAREWILLSEHLCAKALPQTSRPAKIIVARAFIRNKTTFVTSKLHSRSAD